MFVLQSIAFVVLLTEQCNAIMTVVRLWLWTLCAVFLRRRPPVNHQCVASKCKPAKA